MSLDTKIKQLDKLLEKYLAGDKVIKNVEISKLTAPGENFGSIMYKMDINICDKSRKSEEILNAVAKILPEAEMWREMFNVQVTYKNEMAFYDVIIPTLQEFQRELGIQDVIDCFPKFIASRKNLKQESDIIDDDAVLMMENLQISGYRNIDRMVGLDLETSKLILKDIAHFHAASLALKLKKPDVFKEKVKKYCQEYKPLRTKELEDAINIIIAENSETAKFASKVNCWGSINKIPPREPFATLLHQDIWVNNTMQKFVDGKPVSNKFVDFQLIDYGSPASDVIFFIWSSVPGKVLEDNFENLLRYYHDNLTTYLKKHDCDTTPFSYQTFLEEIAAVCDYEIGHSITFHLFAVHGKKGGHSDDKPTTQEYLKHVPAGAKEKVWYMLRDCHERGWLK